MSRYIDADIIGDEWLHGVENEHIYDTNDFINSIDDQPTADVKPVRHAHWITYTSSMRKCSLCDSVRGARWMPYCPHCGAKMDESVKQ